MSKLFGTDGVRGLANQYPMTGEVAMALGRAVSHVLQTTPELHGKTSYPVSLKPLESNQNVRRAKIVVGKDTRLSGYMIEPALTVILGGMMLWIAAAVFGPIYDSFGKME